MQQQRQNLRCCTCTLRHLLCGKRDVDYGDTSTLSVAHALCTSPLRLATFNVSVSGLPLKTSLVFFLLVNCRRHFMFSRRCRAAEWEFLGQGTQRFRLSEREMKKGLFNDAILGCSSAAISYFNFENMKGLN